MPNDNVTLITCTGNRPIAFARCEDYMKRQTYRGNIEWIVVDDGYIPTETTMKVTQKYIRGPKIWYPGINTQRLNMDEALKHVEGKYILIIEDDDWYQNTYIEKMVELLQLYPIVGEGNAKYYNIATRSWKEHRNYTHASLCQTGLIAACIPLLDQAINSGDLYFDITLWKLARKQYKVLLFTGLDLAVGVKGMPGRSGIGVGHTPKEFIADPDFSKLKNLIGDRDALYYQKLLTQKELWKEKML